MIKENENSKIHLIRAIELLKKSNLSEKDVALTKFNDKLNKLC